MDPASCAGQDLQVRKVFACGFGDLEDPDRIADRQDQQTGLFGTGRFQQMDD